MLPTSAGGSSWEFCRPASAFLKDKGSSWLLSLACEWTLPAPARKNPFLLEKGWGRGLVTTSSFHHLLDAPLTH